MFYDLFKKLFGEKQAPTGKSKVGAANTVHGSPSTRDPKSKSRVSDKAVNVEAPHAAFSQSAAPLPPGDSKPQAEPPPAPKIHRASKLLPIDLDIGLDLGTSCTKAVIGDREANRQTAVPLNLGSDLRGYLLPTRVFLENGVYSLNESARSVAGRNLKMRIMEPAIKGKAAETAAMCEFAAFAALTIRRILEWYLRELAPHHKGRTPVWHLNVGLPSRGGQKDTFAPIYRRVMRAAAALAPGNELITYGRVESMITAEVPETAWLPDSRLNTFPEAGAQLASLILSPHRPSGCLLVVDVGAGTMDISTLRIGGAIHAPTLTLHVCEVAPLGVHYLHLARCGVLTTAPLTVADLSRIPDDDGTRPAVTRGRVVAAPVEFVNRCRDSILPVVSRYRQRLKDAHESKAFRPWVDGLPYVLSGGGHRDSFYQSLLRTNLEQWLCNVVSEWHETFPVRPRRGLTLQSFPPPRAFAPKSLLPDFDRFSVAHGLSLGADGLMQMRNVS